MNMNYLVIFVVFCYLSFLIISCVWLINRFFYKPFFEEWDRRYKEVMHEGERADKRTRKSD